MELLPPIHGEDPVFLEVVEAISRIAVLDRPCLVVGERGTGKELLTSRLHYLSPRWDGPLVKINCAALNESILESELFGHEAGAFTGAQRRHIGRFERADGGTLVLDEIASASAAVQEKVLRVIEYGEFERVGGRETVEIDVRVVGASNVDLPALAAVGRFRADLLDRLAFEVLTVPPLRARPTDVLALTVEFGLEMTRALGRDVFPGLTHEAEAALLSHRWPGNVRELKNVIERAVCRASPGDGPIDALVIDPFDSPWRPGMELHSPAADLNESNTRGLQTSSPSRTLTRQALAPPASGFADQVAAFEKDLLEEALSEAHNNQTAASRLLDLSYHQLRRLLDKHELRP